jgi:hypothetical protein
LLALRAVLWSRRVSSENIVLNPYEVALKFLGMVLYIINKLYESRSGPFSPYLTIFYLSYTLTHVFITEVEKVQIITSNRLLCLAMASSLEGFSDLKKSLMFVWRLLGHNISFLTANSHRTCNQNPRWACIVKKTETNISQRALIRHNHSLLNVLYSSPVGINTFGATPVSTACETKQLKNKCCSV